MMNKQKLYFDIIIAIMNLIITMFYNAGITMYDNENPEHCIDYIRFSEASDRLVFYTKKADVD